MPQGFSLPFVNNNPGRLCTGNSTGAYDFNAEVEWCVLAAHDPPPPAPNPAAAWPRVTTPTPTPHVCASSPSQVPRSMSLMRLARSRPRFVSTAAPLIRTSMELPRTKPFDSSPPAANQIQSPQPQPHAALQEAPSTDTILRHMKLQVQRGAEDPFYVVDLNSAVERLQLWKALLPDVQPFYAVKCNPDAMLLSTLAVHGANFDCASRAEMQAVLDLGVPASRIVYANPCKQPSHVRFAAASGVNLTVADNLAELHKVAEHHPGGELLLRLAVDDSQAQCVMSCKYGAPLDEMPALLATALELGLTVRGVSFHVGSGCYAADAFAAAVDRAAQVFELAERAGVAMDVLDIGGGFPGRDTEALSFADIAAALRPALARHFPPSSGVQLIAEPGRYLVAQSHTLAVNVIGKKRAPRTAALPAHDMYFVNDGLYGSFNCVLYDHAQPLQRVLPHQAEAGAEAGAEAAGQAAAGAGAEALCSIWGPTCDGLDCIAKEARLPELQMGDWLYYDDMGAYTAAAGSTFNGMPLPDKHYLPLHSLPVPEQPAAGAASLLSHLASAEAA